MTAPITPAGPEQPRPQRPLSTRPTVDAGQLWSGGVATAVVAGLIALIGVLACRWLLNIAILAPKSDGAYGDVHTTTLVIGSAVVALAATALAHLLLLSTPRPLSFFAWIMALAVVLALLLLFRTGAPLTHKIATGVVYLLIGIAIGSLVSGVGRWATRPRGAVAREDVWPDYQDTDVTGQRINRPQ
ncbi:MAG TPA: DUF6069 family protein [Streptosporangiaceae bacterium]|nr:DUF6069 family protein [Streptosporangiaceae bacterium]